MLAQMTGWKKWDGSYLGGCDYWEHILKWISPSGERFIGPYPKTFLPFPDWPNDLNECRKIEVSFTGTRGYNYCSNLIGVVMEDMSCGYGPDGEIEGDDFRVFTASATQRTVALILTILSVN